MANDEQNPQKSTAPQATWIRKPRKPITREEQALAKTIIVPQTPTPPPPLQAEAESFVLVLDEPWTEDDVVEPAPDATFAGDEELESEWYEDREFSIEGYELIKLLGRGGMGEVYLANRAVEQADGSKVLLPCVVKTIIEDDFGVDPKLQEMFLDEARICAGLQHSNIVTTMDVGQTSDRLYIALEWIDGLDVLELIELAKRRNTPIPLEHVLFIVRETLKGLHYAHTAMDHLGQPLEIIHRDISPGNILISRHGSVKLADFGVALGRAAQSDVNKKGTVGKPGYIAAEVWQGKGASVQSDIFAMGATLYELLAREPLFDLKDNFWALALEIATFDPQVLVTLQLTPFSGIKDLLIKDFLLNTLANDPTQRYGSALEFLEDINDFCYETGVRLLDVHFAAFIEEVVTYREQLGEEA